MGQHSRMRRAFSRIHFSFLVYFSSAWKTRKYNSNAKIRLFCHKNIKSWTHKLCLGCFSRQPVYSWKCFPPPLMLPTRICRLDCGRLSNYFPGSQINLCTWISPLMNEERVFTSPRDKCYSIFDGRYCTINYFWKLQNKYSRGTRSGIYRAEERRDIAMVT